MIQFTDVTKIYKRGELEARALNAVPLTLNEGGVVAIMGSSGFAESTMSDEIQKDWIFEVDSGPKPQVRRQVRDGTIS